MLERIHWPTLLKTFGHNSSRCAALTGALYLLEIQTRKYYFRKYEDLY